MLLIAKLLITPLPNEPTQQFTEVAQAIWGLLLMNDIRSMAFYSPDWYINVSFFFFLNPILLIFSVLVLRRAVKQIAFDTN